MTNDYEKKKKSMTNDYEEIKKSIGYYPGNLYLFTGDECEKMEQIDKEERFEKGHKGIYDKSSGNIHIVPREGYKKENELLNKINKKRGAIISKLKGAIIDKLKNEGFTLDEGKGKNGGAGQLKFEKYIQVNNENSEYLLCFERLYHHKNEIHCILGKFQFYKVNKGSFVNKGTEQGQMDCCYPCGYKDGKQKMNSKGNIVKNSDFSKSVFEINDKDVGDIIEEFIAFIKED